MAVTNRQQSQAVWIGAGLTSEDSTTPFLSGQVGMVLIKGDKVYQLVKFDSFVFTYADGKPLVWKDEATFVVTADYDDTTNNRNRPAGVALLASTAGNTGWIQVGGPHAGIFTKTAESAAAGDALVYDAADGQVIKTAAGTAPVCVPLAIATGAQATNATPGNIIVPHNGW